MKAKLGLVCLFLSIGTVGCGGGGSGDLDLPSINNQEDIGLEGRWLSNCAYFKDDNTYYIDLVEFDGDQVTVESDYWDNQYCAGSPEESYLLEGTFSVGSEIRTSSGVDAHEITFNFTDPDGAITISGAVLVENTVLYFGMEDTASGLPQINYNAVYTKQ